VFHFSDLSDDQSQAQGSKILPQGASRMDNFPGYHMIKVGPEYSTAMTESNPRELDKVQAASNVI